MNQVRHSVAEVDSFITLLSVACEDDEVRQQLEKILSLPDEQRKLVLRGLLGDMRRKGAPPDFAAALACLLDDAVAERAHVVIFKCRRGVAPG